MTVTAVVLAGGRSSRFGGDKLAADLGGTSVLAATIEALASVADEVIVAGPGLPGDVFDGPVALVVDRAPFDGPLAALANVLEPLRPDPRDVGIVVGGDMPRLVPAVLVTMLDHLDGDPSLDAVLLGRPSGSSASGASGASNARRRQVLPLVIRLYAGRAAALRAVEDGDRSLQALVDRLPHIELPAAEWLALDPGAATLTDIDTRADLDRLNAP